MIKKIIYKGQGIKIIKKNDVFKLTLNCFPKKRKATFKQLIYADEFTTLDGAIKKAKERIDLELENGTWEEPHLEGVDKILKEKYE